MKKITLYYKIENYQELLVKFYKTKPFDFFLITCIFTLTIFKLNLIGEGFLSMIDESRYLLSGKVIEHIFLMDFSSAVNDVFSAEGRPGDVLIKIIPNAFQFFTAYIFKVDIYDCRNSYPLFIFNFLVYILLLILHFKFSKLILKDSTLSLTSVLLFCSLTNSYIYLRHALPYDSSLLLFYFVIFYIVKKRDTYLKFSRYLFMGILSFFSYLIYPGYVTLLFLIALFIFFYKLNLNIKRNFINSVFFVLGNLLCLLLIEFISKIGGRSYTAEALKLSGTITQGSFEESFTFLFKYLFIIEKWTGIIIFISLPIYLFISFKKYLSKEIDNQSQPLFLLLILMSGLFFIYACLGYFADKVVFYGRLLHQYIPFICLATIFSLSTIIKKYKWSKIILVVSIVLNFIYNFCEYKAYAYPRDLICKLRNLNLLNNVNYVFEYDGYLPIMMVNELKSSNKFQNENKKITILNGAFILNVNDLTEKYHKFKNEKKYNLTFSKPYFLSFKGYQFEGCNIKQRNNLDKIKLKLELYSK